MYFEWDKKKCRCHDTFKKKTTALLQMGEALNVINVTIADDSILGEGAHWMVWWKWCESCCDLHSRLTSVKLNTNGRFWSSVLRRFSPPSEHHQNAKLCSGGMPLVSPVELRDLENMYDEEQWSCSRGSWWTNTLPRHLRGFPIHMCLLDSVWLGTWAWRGRDLHLHYKVCLSLCSSSSKISRLCSSSFSVIEEAANKALPIRLTLWHSPGK